MKSRIEIDVGGVKTSGELHELLAERLSFPHFYGKNWDAFWDSITGLVGMPRELILINMDKLEKNLPQDALMLVECLEEMTRDYPDIRCEVKISGARQK